MRFGEFVQRYGSACGALELLPRAALVDDERLAERGDPRVGLALRHRAAQFVQFAHLQDFGMGAEDGALQPEVGVDVDHAAVVVAQQSHAVAAHAAGDLRRVDPPVDLGPGLRVVEVARHHVVFGAGAVEYRTEFGQRTGLAVGKPLARHHPAVGHAVEAGVVDGRGGLQVEQHDRDALAEEGDERGRKGVGRDEDEQHFGFVAPEKGRGCVSLVHVVDHACVGDDLPAVGFHFFLYGVPVAVEPFAQSAELVPVGVQPYCDQSYFHGL